MPTNRLTSLLAFAEADPTDPFNHYALALEYLGLGDTESATRCFEHLLAQHPDYLATYYHYGKYLETVPNLARATELYKQGIAKAQHQQNNHALRELKEALANWEDPDDDDWA
jgi:tetratricopeptide (TPR) repeat protein